MPKRPRSLTTKEIQLQELLEIANLVPGYEPVLSLFEMERSSDIGANTRPERIRAWLKYLATFSDLANWLNLKEFSFEDASDIDPFDRVGEIYGKVDHFRKVRNITNLVVSRAQDFRERLAAGQVFYYFDPIDLSYVTLWIGEREKIDASTIGKIHFELDPILEVFDGLDAAKIVRCENCQKVFWQNRKDKKACSKKCSTAIGMRTFRGQPINK